MIGNAHIDPVWLWRWQASVDEALASFRSAADRCDEYPEFIFTRGESWLYEQVERLDPELFERVRMLIQRGQWHVTGGQYLQPDVNLPTASGLRRQVQHGRRYFRDRFGIKPNVGYNVDSFGHPASLPDILADLDFIGYVFHRPHPDQLPLPAQTFRWRGVNGNEVIGFRIEPGYTTEFADLSKQITTSVKAADEALGHTMCFYGVGNHGGGPTKGNIEFILEHQHSFPDVELRFSTPERFFNEVLAKRDALPIVSTELQRTFPGCYSVMHDVKQEQRHGEHLLDQCQQVIDQYAHETERPTLRERLDRAWDDLLFTAFHDILAGTSIPSAWPSVRAMQGRARITAEEIITHATRHWARSALPTPNHQQLVLINPDEETWSGQLEAEPWLDLDVWGDRWLSTLDGDPVPCQLVQPEAPQIVTRILFPIELAAEEGRLLLVRDDPKPRTPEAPTDLEVTESRLANSYFDIHLSTASIGQLRFKGRPLLGEAGATLHLRQDSTDTWTFHTDRFTEAIASGLNADGWVVEESGPLRARVRLDGVIGSSQLRWTLSLPRNSSRLSMQVEVLFAEKFKLLQMPLQLAAQSVMWTAGLAAGCVKRAPEPTEWPVNGWASVPIGGTQLAVVTGDAYSASLQGNTWQWTLLRSPKMAWGGGQPKVYAGRDWHTDQGMHSFYFELFADEQLEAADLHRAARQQLQQPIVFDRYEGMNRPLRPAGKEQPLQSLFSQEGGGPTRH
jgi:alpha-mannosidase